MTESRRVLRIRGFYPVTMICGDTQNRLRCKRVRRSLAVRPRAGAEIDLPVPAKNVRNASVDDCGRGAALGLGHLHAGIDKPRHAVPRRVGQCQRQESGDEVACVRFVAAAPTFGLSDQRSAKSQSAASRASDVTCREAKSPLPHAGKTRPITPRPGRLPVPRKST